jgi:MATE family multidrug resistance protein
VIGAGISMAITQITNLIIITIYIHFKNPCPQSYIYLDKDMLNAELFYDYVKTALPAAIIFAADWLGFEVLTLMASYLSSVDLAANICLFNFITIIFMLSMGMSLASSTLVGNSIGARKPNTARQYTKSALATGMISMSIITIIVMLNRHT